MSVRLLATRMHWKILQGSGGYPFIISLTYGNKRFGEIKRGHCGYFSKDAFTGTKGFGGI